MAAKMKDQIKDIPVDSIIVPGRHRTPMHGKVAAIAESIRMNCGILQPIMVRHSQKHEGKYDLVFGAHRLAGAKAEKLTTISAIITTKNDLECELAEIDENFQHTSLSVIEQSVSLARRRQICAILTQQRTPSDSSMRVPSDGTLPIQEGGMPVGDFLPEAITLTGLSAKTATERANLGDKLSSVASDLLKDTPTGDSVKQVTTLSELPKSEQVEVAKAIKSGEADSVKEAIAARDGEPPDVATSVLLAKNSDKIKPTHDQLVKLAAMPEKQQNAIMRAVDEGKTLAQAMKDGKAEDAQPTDAIGNAIPKELVPIFVRAADFNAAMNTISQAKKAAHSFKDDPAGACVDWQELDRLLDQARHLLKFSAPHCQCAKCRGKVTRSCPACHGRGWVQQSMFRSSFSDEDKAWLSK